MTPTQMAALYKLAFTDERPWSVQEFSDLREDRFVDVYHSDHGYALTRTVAGESELISIAVHPDHRRTGIARRLMGQWLAALRETADSAFLEVAADNLPALKLYAGFGFTVTGRRAAYYKRMSGGSVDAFLMSCPVFPDDNVDSDRFPPEIG